MPRASRGANGKAAEALRRLAEARESGRRPSEDYELEEPERVYEAVDEDTYRSRRAEERHQVRSFIVKDRATFSGSSEDEDCLTYSEEESEGRTSARSRVRAGRQRSRERGSSATVARNLLKPTQTRFLGQSTVPGTLKIEQAALATSVASHGRVQSASSSGRRKSLVDELLAEQDEWAAGEERTFVASRARGNDSRPLDAQPNQHPTSGVISAPRRRCGAQDLLVESGPQIPLESRSDTDHDHEHDPRTPSTQEKSWTTLQAANASDSENDMEVNDVDADLLLDRVLELEAEYAHEATENGVTAVEGDLPGDRVPALTFFALDMQEILDKVFVFGRALLPETSSSTAVCVQVCGIEREIFFLPRMYVDCPDDEQATPRPYPILASEQEPRLAPVSEGIAFSCVYEEVKSVLLARGITEFTARREERCFLTNQIDRRRAEVTSCLRVRYPAKYRALETALEGQTFSQIVGSRNSPLENFILERCVPGPCWVQVSNASRVTGISSCRCSLNVDSPAQFRVLAAEEIPASQPPGLRVLTFSLRTIAEASPTSFEIAIICATVFDNVPTNRNLGETPHPSMQFGIVRPPAQEAFPFGFERMISGRRILRERNELAMIERFLREINQLDPDVIICHQLLTSQFDVFLKRMRELRLRDWWQLGRLVQRRPLQDFRSHMQASGRGLNPALARQIFAGRLLCDTEEAAREYLHKEKDYGLRVLCRALLGSYKSAATGSDGEWSAQAMRSVYREAKHLVGAIDSCLEDAKLSFLLADRLAVIPLTNELASICGYPWGKTMLGNRAERIEYLLLHEIHRSGKYVAPDRSSGQRASIRPKRPSFDPTAQASADKRLDAARTPSSTQRGASTPTTTEGSALELASSAKRRKPAYQGGYVLEPKRGLYGTCVLQLDFSSLYPSIIQEYNIDFTTVTLDSEGNALLPKHSNELGILPTVLRRLVQRRRQVREAARNESSPVRQQQLHTRQLALKLTANALYGCLGYVHSRFHIRELAELITRTGRETLERTVELAEQVLLRKLDDLVAASNVPDRASGVQPRVIYGDTDSIFIDSGIPFSSDSVQRIMELGHAIRREVNKQYHTLEIEIEALYVRMLLLNKKKYAALKYEIDTGSFSKEVKGIEVVRHDWCALVAAAGNFALDQILDPTCVATEAKDRICKYLSELATRMRQGRVDLDQFVITKQLTHDPDAYDDAAIQPHVQVALRRRERGYVVAAGTFIQYVVCREPCDTRLRRGEANDGARAPIDTVARRACHPDEYREAQGMLHLDIDWYLENQLHAVLRRITESVPGLDAAALACCLGLNAQPFLRARIMADQMTPGSTASSQDQRRKLLVEDLFGALSDPLVVPFTAQCPACDQRFPIDFRFEGEHIRPAIHIDRCPRPACGAVIPVTVLKQQLIVFIRHVIRRYYTSPELLRGHACRAADDDWLAHQDSDVTSFPLSSESLLQEGISEREYGERTLYAQLERLQLALGKNSDDPDAEKPSGGSASTAAVALQALVQSYLDACAYQYVELRALFS